MSDDSRIEDLLDQYEEACERGEAIDVEQLCRSDPELFDEVKRRIHILDRMNDRLAGWGDDQEPTELRFETKISEMRFHAKGGLGAVYIGKDQQLHRLVAIKFIHRDRAKDPTSRHSFALESEITGRLEHPGIIPLYGSGQSESGRPFYAMRFIDGQTLDESIRNYHALRFQTGKGDNIQFRRMLLSFIAVCKAIAYAHNRGIIHRDIKPDNVMLGKFGETIVVDWGLAIPVAREERFRVSGEKTLMPNSGSHSGSSDNTAGTPAYMSPEQASRLSATPASDIYSLGGTLYKILTGRPPVQGDSIAEIKTKIIEGRIAKPSELNPSIDRALEKICAKAMAIQPSDRYATALDFSFDLEKYLADEPIAAYRETVAEKMARFFRHHRLTAAIAVGGLCICFLIAGLASVWLAGANRRERESHRIAEVSRRENLSTSAMFLAKSVAYEMELYWKILESEAESSTLRELLQPLNQLQQQGETLAANDLQELQRWAEKRYIAASDSVNALAWCVYSMDGTQVARVPEAPSIGQNFSHRDYFHAEGRDYSRHEIEGKSLVPLGDKNVYTSNVYQGSNTQTLLISFSVPIWSESRESKDRTRIGVLSFPVELGEFSLGSRAILVDTRPDQLKKQAGLILNHPKLDPQGISQGTPYLIPGDLDRAKQHAIDRNSNELLSTSRSNILENFYDPVEKQVRLVALEPVILRGRKNRSADASGNPGVSLGDTGWIVIAMEEDDRSEAVGTESTISSHR